MRLLPLALLLAACHRYPDDVGPLGIPLRHDGVVYAGAAVVDMTPEIVETYTDLNGDGTFEGCLDDPTGARCGEPFDDVDGDGWFDAVFMGGYGPMRPATSVHDPITARAFVVAEDGEYVAFVGLDLVGLGSPRIHAARDQLLYDGFDPDRLLVASTHNHQGPDTMGLWGNPYDFADPVSGMNPDYQQRVSDSIEEAVREAAGSMEPVTLRVAAVRTRDTSKWLNGSVFGGENPKAYEHGLVNDIRDPIVVSDQLLVMQGRRDDGSAVFTFTNWSGHPETWGGSNNALSADWVGVARQVLEEQYGGVAIHMPECLGGMQSALGGDVPLYDDQGTPQYQTDDVGNPVVDAAGDPVPQWAPADTYDFVRSHGYVIGNAAIAALEDDSEEITATPIDVKVAELYVPVENIAYQILGPSGVFDLGFDDMVTDPERCPDVADGDPGCLPTRTFQARVGPVGFAAVPGELLPEVAWGFPTDDPEWQVEADNPQARGAGSTYFPQHDHDCDDVPYSECQETDAVGDCDCLAVHAAPYVYAADADMPPLLDLLPDDVRYRAALSMTDNYMSYIVPEPDFNRWVSLLRENDGDHYEDTVSPAHNFATRVQEAQLTLQGKLAQP